MVKAMTFDVFGTVVDWRSSIIKEGQELSGRLGFEVDWAQFADDWRAGYGPAMRRVRNGELPWTRIDDLHRMILDELIPKHGPGPARRRGTRPAQPGLAPAAAVARHGVRADPLAHALHARDAVPTATWHCLRTWAKHSGLPWDVVLSSELARHYKPDPEVYLMAADLLGLEPEEVMMVAAPQG